MKSTPARVAGSILTRSMRVRTLSLSRTKSFLHMCIRGRVGLSSTMSHEGVGFKPQSLRRRGFEPHRMHLIHLTDWRNGSASDSSPYRLWCVAATAWRRWRGGYAIMPSPRPRRAVERTQIDDENHRVSIIEKRGADGTHHAGSSSARSRPTGSTASTSSSARSPRAWRSSRPSRPSAASRARRPSRS